MIKVECSQKSEDMKRAEVIDVGIPSGGQNSPRSLWTERKRKPT
jgi:hypothetical protein